MLELLWRMGKVVGVGLGNEPTLIGLLDKILVSLLLGKSDGLFLCPEGNASALHAICG